MRIKLFETFEEPNFRKMSQDEFIEKINSRARASWCEWEIEEVTKLFQEELGSKNCKVIDSNALFPTAFISIEILNGKKTRKSISAGKGIISNLPWKVETLYIIKQEDEWFFITGIAEPAYIECDQFSGLVDCIKQLFKK
jgi:hypothetical protein